MTTPGTHSTNATGPTPTGTVLVVGATGAQGRPAAQAFLAAGWKVRALTRDASRAAALVEAGADAVVGDLRDPSSVRAAAAGADVAYYHTPMSVGGPDGAPAEQAALAAIRAAGVRHLIVNTGFALPDNPVGVAMLDARVAAVQHLLAEGATVLIPTGYMENFSAAWSRPLIVAGELRYPRPAEDLVAWVTADDVGAAAVHAAQRPDVSRGRAFRLAGPDVLTFLDVARLLSDVVGRPVTFRQVSGTEYGELVGAVLGPQVGAGIGAGYDQMPPFPNPLLAPDTTPARTELGLAFTPFATWAARQEWTA